MANIKKWIDHNRFIVIFPVVAFLIWGYAASCTPRTPSPIDPGRQVDERGLGIEYKRWEVEQVIVAAKFEAAGEDLQEQRDNLAKIQKTIMTIATGNVADVPGLLRLLLGGGGIGAVLDNIRKRGLIAGLKRNKK